LTECLLLHCNIRPGITYRVHLQSLASQADCQRRREFLQKIALSLNIIFPDGE